ncbi:MAG: lipoate--protein ligase family protein [Aquificaceae bacterium]|nr:lipoate--protein ligase family protein [Aquificaceae bacterium]MDW8095943.1 lipoate--protein ligase family protein [Aquificaceae bacterium]
MKAYTLGQLGNMLSTTLFHAMAELGYEALILCEPEDTYISLGFFDKAEDIVDLKKCSELGVEVIRRRVGGGAVLLAPGQVFYQLILSKSKVPFKVEDAYKKLSQPVIRAYARLGLEVEYKPINDIVVKKSQRKISGQGAGDIGKLFVFVGNILIKFDPDMMAELFAIEDRAIREEVRKSLWENISWLQRELEEPPSSENITRTLLEEFSKEFELEVCQQIPEDAYELAKVLRQEMTSAESIFEDTGREHKFIKIREGVYIKKA